MYVRVHEDEYSDIKYKDYINNAWSYAKSYIEYKNKKTDLLKIRCDIKKYVFTQYLLYFYEKRLVNN
jgi:hypothetical protein